MLLAAPLVASSQPQCSGPPTCVDRRPPPAERSFTSVAIDSYIARLSANMTGKPELACLFRNTLPNTLDTTVQLGEAVDEPPRYELRARVETAATQIEG